MGRAQSQAPWWKSMLPFWNLWGDEKSVRVEDPEKGLTMEAQEKRFSGNINGMNVQASFKSFSIQGSNEMPNNLLGFFNPFGFFMGNSPQNQSIEDQSGEKKKLK